MCTKSWQRNTEGLKMSFVIFEIELRFTTMLIPTLNVLRPQSVYLLIFVQDSISADFPCSDH